MELDGDTGSFNWLRSAHGQMDGQVVALSVPLVDERPSQLQLIADFVNRQAVPPQESGTNLKNRRK
jgi:hypothetical protein